VAAELRVKRLSSAPVYVRLSVATLPSPISPATSRKRSRSKTNEPVLLRSDRRAAEARLLDAQ
jgi:hypothetical protein